MQLMGITRPHVGFAWQQGDRVTPKWYPQGITGLRSSSSVNASQKFVVVTCAGRAEENYDHKGVRLSFCDVTDMDAIRIGMCCWCNLSRTSACFSPSPFTPAASPRMGTTCSSPALAACVFDANRIFKGRRMPPSRSAGCTAPRVRLRLSLHPAAGGAVHVARRWRALLNCSTDLTNPSAPRLFTGNYHDHDSAKYRNPPALISWWDLDGGSIVSGHARVETQIENVQGALALGDRVWMSGGGSTPRLRVGKVTHGDFALVHPGFSWPRGCEDLHYSTISDNLWCLSEYPYTYVTDLKNNRFVWAVKLSDYTP